MTSTIDDLDRLLRALENRDEWYIPGLRRLLLRAKDDIVTAGLVSPSVRTAVVRTITDDEGWEEDPIRSAVIRLWHSQEP